MSGALARNWDYEDDDNLEVDEPQLILLSGGYDEEAEDELYLETEEEYVPAYGALSAYTTSFTRQQQREEANYLSGSNQSYSYAYQERLRPRRQARVTPLDSILGLIALIPARLFLIVAVVGVMGWFVISNGVSLMGKGTDSAKSIYQFGGSSSVAVGKAPISSGNALLGSPTINPAKIDAVLQQYNSPASGSGQAIYDLGLRYGINPAYALAFFIHESSAGTQGVAAITKSIGNIRCTSGYECYQTGGNGSFRRYASWEAGAEDWYKLIKEQYIQKWNLKTLDQIIPVYAPSADRNNPATYIQQVASLVASWQSGK